MRGGLPLRPFLHGGALLLAGAASLACGPTVRAQAMAEEGRPPRGTAPVSEIAPRVAPRVVAPADAGVCVEVDVAGQKVGHLDCAAQRLQAAARAAQARAPNAAAVPVPGAGSADVVTGVANQTATRQRMGNTFGTGVRPQRPLPPVFTLPKGRQP